MSLKLAVQTCGLRGITFIAALLFCEAGAFGQADTATVEGHVSDSSGAGIAQATITVKNVQTGLKRSVTSNGSADYSVPLLPVGTYDVTAVRPGFKKEVQTNVVLQIDQHARVDLTLSVGSASQTVEVTSTVPLTQTDSASTGSVIDNRKVVELPLNSRQFYSLALLVPGVAPPAQSSLLSFRGGFNVAGISELDNNFTLDGFDDNNQLLSAPSFRPSIDAIQEFKILTGTYSAEYGRNAGGQVIVTTKTGTNEFHGTVFEFLRNSAVEAKNYFTPANVPTPAFKRNQFGGTVGGPIIRNKTFFFASYEGLRSTQQVTAQTTVPTAQMLRGDFSQIPVTIYDPATYNAATKKYSAFQGNVIPANRMSTIGQAFASYYPTPTAATPAGQVPRLNYTFNEPQTDNQDLGSLRIDHSFSLKDTVYGTYNDFEENTLYQGNVVCGSRVIPGFDCTVGLVARLAGLSETHIFNPTTINQFRFGYQRFQNPRHTNDQNVNFLEQYGITGTRTGAASFPGVPQANVQGFATIGEPTNFPQVRTDNTWQYADSLSHTTGGHSLTFGVDFRRFQTNGQTVGNGRGSFSFTPSSTAPTSGYSFADLLLGVPQSTARSPLTPHYYDRTSNIGIYAQDDWKISQRLTVNLGLRYEYNTPVFDKYNIVSNFDPSTGGVVIPGQNNYPQGL